MCLAHDVKKIVEKVPQRTVILPGRWNKLIEQAILGCREEHKQLTVVGYDPNDQ